MPILLFMVLLMPFEKNPYLYISESFLGLFPDFTMIKLIGLVGLAWVILDRMQGGPRLGLLDALPARMFGWFLLAVVFGTLMSGTGFNGLRRITAFLSLMFFMPLVLRAVRTEQDLRRVLQAAVLTMMLILPYGYRQMLRFGGRFGVGLYEPNYLALMVVALFPVAYLLFRQEPPGWKRVFWLGGAGALLIELILGGSRGAFLAFGVAVGLIGLLLVRRRVLAIGAGALLLVGLLFVVPSALSQRLMASGLSQDVRMVSVERSTDLRIALLKAGLRMVRDHPLTGVGLGGFKLNSRAYGAAKGKFAHNTYLEVAAELGLGAFVAYLCLVGGTLLSLRRSAARAVAAGNPRLGELLTAMQIGFAAVLVGNLFLSASFEKIFWLLVFLTCAAERITRTAAVPAAAPAPAVGPTGLAPGGAWRRAT